MSEKLKEKEVKEIKEDVEIIKDVTNEPKKRGRKKKVTAKEEGKEKTEKEIKDIVTPKKEDNSTNTKKTTRKKSTSTSKTVEQKDKKEEQENVSTTKKATKKTTKTTKTTQKSSTDTAKSNKTKTSKVSSKIQEKPELLDNVEEKEQEKNTRKVKTTNKATTKAKQSNAKKQEQSNKKEKQKEIEDKVELKKDEEIISENTKEKLEKIEKEDSKKEDSEKENIVLKENRQDNIETDNIEETNKSKDKKSRKLTIIISIISAILLISFMVFSTIFALKNRTTDKIVSGVSIKGEDVSGLTIQEARDKVNKKIAKKTTKDIILKHGEYEITLIPEQIEAKFNIEQALNSGYNIGRSGKILKDNYAIINSYISKKEITPTFSYNEEAINSFVSGISANLPDAVKQSSYYVDDNNLIINKGTAGLVVDEVQLKNMILDNIVNLKLSEEAIDIPTKMVQPDKIDIEKIHKEIYKEPKDAYFTKSPFKVYPHVNGVDFKISMEEATNLLNNDAQEITIPLKITTPKVTTNQIGTEAFPNLLATYSTTFSTSNGNRTNNIRLASNKINGVVVLPGEEFSYNKVVGKRTAQAGFKPAAAYSGGKVVQELGGGICQVSSTLYNTVLRANLAIVKRSNHRFATGYCPLSTDATVSWGGPEFIFKNSRKYPIKIVSTVNGGRIKVDVYGCKEEVEYDVEIKSETLQTIPMQTVYRTNTNLPAGTQQTVQKGHGGYKSRAYRILKLDGKVVSKTLLSTDTYAQLETIIEKN